MQKTWFFWGFFSYQRITRFMAFNKLTSKELYKINFRRNSKPSIPSILSLDVYGSSYQWLLLKLMKGFYLVLKVP